MSEKILVLRTCSADGTSRNGFRWPKRGKVVAPDWDPKPVCGRGLHGLPGGEGDDNLLDWSPSARWQVVRVDGPWVDLGRKIKFECGYVLHTGTQESATSYLAARAPGRAVVGLVASGDILTGGYKSVLSGGYYSTLIGGDCSTLTGGYKSALTGGDYSVLAGGKHSTLTGGHHSTLTGGDYSTLIGGRNSILVGGYGSALIGGYKSILTGGDGSILTAGENSTLYWRIWDGKYYRLHVVYVGEDGIKPDVAYRWSDGGPEEVRNKPSGRLLTWPLTYP